MSNGTYEEFRDALRAFESGWDRDRYDAGIIQDWQLDQWAGGPVTDFYPGYSSWSDLTDAEWDAMSYMSTNTLGFVGYQFGEALLIDLGYYDDDVFYGNGAATNTWDGTWTGKNGVTSLADFMTKEKQEVAIQEAFGYNLKIIQDGLAQNGESLDDYLGTTRTYMDNGTQVTVTLTLTGIMAAAHLRGAWGTLSLLQAGDVSTDENGTSILRYVDTYGGYDSPGVDEAIAFYEDRLTGDEGLGTPGDGGSTGGDTGGSTGGGADGDALNNPGITKDNADVVVTWSYGQDSVVTDFDPATDTLFVDWFSAADLDITEVNGSVVFTVTSNAQSTTLQDVSLADLQADNIHMLDATAREELSGLMSNDSTGGGGTGGGDTGGGDTGGGDTGGGDTGGGDTGGGDTGGGDTGGGGTGGGSGLPDDAPIVAAYFPEWGIYGRDYNISDVPADQLTHLIYAFAKIDDAGKISLYDSYAATDKAFSDEDSVDGVADTWEGQDLRGNFNQIAELKAANPHLKTSIAVGGWTLSGNFSTMADSAEGRATFARSVKDFLIEYDMFDGIDLDWEYPGGGGLGSNAVSPEDGLKYALLVADIRTALNELEAETGREYEISVAAPGGYDKIANFNLAGLEPNVDFFNLMSYDFYGAWQDTTGHQAAMFDLTGNQYDITSAVDFYLDDGVPAEKIVLGAPMYTRAWKDVDATGPGDAWNKDSGGGAPGSFETGVYDYKDLLAKVQDPNSGWKLYYDDEAQAAYVWNADEKIFSSIETPETISLKSEWAQAKGLGGMMFWDLSNDATGSGESLLKAASDSWFKGMTFDEIAAASSLEWEEIFGGDGIVKPIAEADTPVIDLGGGDTGGGDTGGGDTGGGDTGGGDTGGGDTGGGDTGGGDTGGGDTGGGDTGGGDTGGGDTGGGHTGGGSVNGDDLDNPAITAANADVAINWTYGQDVTVTGFDPATDTIFINWFSADDLEITEVDGSTVIAVPGNSQSTTLDGVALSDLVAANIHAQDASARDELAALIGNSGDGHGDGHGDGGDDGHGDGHGGMTGTMHMITLATASQTIDGFDPATDMIHVEQDVTAENFLIFEESGTLGDTVRISVTNGDASAVVIFTGITLSDLTMANFSIADQGVQNEVVAAIGATVTTPDGDGYTLTYDNDGSNPVETTGASEAGGVKYKADSNADDITGFDPATDELDFGGTSVHGMIVTKSEAGEIVIDSPWSDAAQIVQGVTYQDVTIDSFGVVGNEHFRQDIGGVVSWEQGIGPRDANTVYVRSHEYGVQEVVNDFDPSVNKISFLYFGTRERLSVEDTAEGLVISSLPSGQSVTLTNVTKADLQPGLVEFHHDQVMEDNLEVPFGFDQNDVTLVDRTVLLTPDAPAGDTTDGYQTRDGVTGETGGGSNGDTGGNTGSGDGATITLGAGADTVEITWDWGAETTVDGFDFAEDVLDFNGLASGDLQVSETATDLVFEVLGNGGHTVTLTDVRAEDLSRANLTADAWNSVTDDDSGLVQQLQALGFDLG